MADLSHSQFLGGVLGIDRNPPVDPSDSAREHDAEWKDAPLVQVPVRGLVATQTYLDPDKVEHYRQGGNRRGRKIDQTPRVVFDGSTPYLIDGHHRAVAAALEGDESIEARVRTR